MFVLRHGSEGNIILFLGAVIVLATVVLCCAVAYLISKRLAVYGFLYYGAASLISLVFSVMAVNNDWLRMGGPYNGLFSVYATLMGIAFGLSLLAALLVRVFWNDKF